MAGKLTDISYPIGTIQGKYQPDGILGYIGHDYVLESLGGQSTFKFSVPRNEDLVTDASVTQSSLSRAAKQLKVECLSLFLHYLACHTDVLKG